MSEADETRLEFGTDNGGEPAGHASRTSDAPAPPEAPDLRTPDPFAEDASVQPLDDNPFPLDTPAHDAFEEAEWETKERIGELRSKFVTAYETRPDFSNALYRYRLGYFSAVAYGRLSMVGNAATGELYGSWVDNFAKDFLTDTFSRLERLKDFGESPFLPLPEETEVLRNNLRVTTLKMVTHYKRAAASKVREALKMKNAPRNGRVQGGDVPELKKWDELDIRFLSDERIQITVDQITQTRNYSEFGFEDGRTQKPNLAWLTLRSLGQLSGTIQRANKDQDLAAVEKRMQEIRRVLRTHFKLESDPIPFLEGTGYKARFKIRCAPSFDS